MRLYNPTLPRYRRQDGPTFRETGKINYWMDDQSYCTWVTAEILDGTMLDVIKHESLAECEAHWKEMAKAEYAPSLDEGLADTVIGMITGEDKDEE